MNLYKFSRLHRFLQRLHNWFVASLNDLTDYPPFYAALFLASCALLIVARELGMMKGW